ncbi:MAG: hypothetical protein C0524_16440 [Rhodobacter sp.]|nr:hypothetical protein [Rhodobacter sp.]
MDWRPVGEASFQIAACKGDANLQERIAPDSDHRICCVLTTRKRDFALTAFSNVYRFRENAAFRFPPDACQPKERDARISLPSLTDNPNRPSGRSSSDLSVSNANRLQSLEFPGFVDVR